MAKKLPFYLIIVPPSWDFSGLCPPKRPNPALPRMIHHFIIGAEPKTCELISCAEIPQHVMAACSLHLMDYDAQQKFYGRVRNLPDGRQQLAAILKTRDWFATLQTVQRQVIKVRRGRRSNKRFTKQLPITYASFSRN